ncbi:hypothetical protein [Pseudanabaena sp. UWO310]|uniref:hypothetical protein n=1 Tax=Pseudanabaena sp. UWO310 TaxID=2480795 RepID=UPI00115B5F2D|nr:hypothetical protein [Pseudanabaena sp. UWO310]TYQ30384.1 hypothetical protein PseudUWO310_08940 [Pseudanabaena sp. UWO310]
MKELIQYFSEIQLDKSVLWCYLIWYVVIVSFYFDPSPKIWSNSIGISAVIGTGLMLSISSNGATQRDTWQTFRLYLMPFCVSSFSALIKDKGFIVFISPHIQENLVALSCCIAFGMIIWAIKSFNQKSISRNVSK